MNRLRFKVGDRVQICVPPGKQVVHGYVLRARRHPLFPWIWQYLMTYKMRHVYGIDSEYITADTRWVNESKMYDPKVGEKHA